jgi:hypothetical protein
LNFFPSVSRASARPETPLRPRPEAAVLGSLPWNVGPLHDPLLETYLPPRPEVSNPSSAAASKNRLKRPSAALLTGGELPLSLSRRRPHPSSNLELSAVAATLRLPVASSPVRLKFLDALRSLAAPTCPEHSLARPETTGTIRRRLSLKEQFDAAYGRYKRLSKEDKMEEKARLERQLGALVLAMAEEEDEEARAEEADLA